MAALTAKIFGLAASKAQEYGQEKIAEYIAKTSQEFGVLSDEQFQLLAAIPKLITEQNKQQANQNLQSLSNHLSATEWSILYTYIEGNQSQELDQWVQKRKEFTGTSGLVKKVAATFTSTIGKTVKDHLGSWYKDFSAPAPELNAFSGLLQGISQPQESTPHIHKRPEQVAQEIQHQTNLLVQNGTMMTTARLILIWVCGENSTHEALASYIEDTHKTQDSFRTSLFNKIDQLRNISFPRKFLGKSCFYVFHPIVGFYVRHFTQRFLSYIESLLGQFYNGHFTEALNRSVKFGNNHLHAVSGAYKNAAEAQDRDVTIDELIQRDLARPLHNSNMTREVLYVRFAKEGVEKFAPVSTLRSRVSDLLSTRISSSSFWSWLNYPISAFTGLVSISITPALYLIEVGSNLVAKAALKKLALDLNLVPKLLASTGQAMGLGNEYKHAMNELLVRQLEKAHRLMLETKESGQQMTLSEFERNLSDETRNNLKTFVSSLFENLGCALHSDTPTALNSHLKAIEAQTMPESLKALLEAAGIPLDIQGEAKETTVKYLALLLGTVLNQETLQELTLTSLTTLNQSCFTRNSNRPTEEQMRATEMRRNKLLNEIITIAIRKAVNDKFYPMKRIQKEADQFVLKLHADVTQFSQVIEELRVSKKFSEMGTAYRQFILSRDKALTSQQGSPNVNNHSLTNFNTISKALSEKLTPMQAVLTELSTLEQKTSLADKGKTALEQLANVFNRLNEDHSDQDVQDLTLSMIAQAKQEILPLIERCDDLGDLCQEIVTSFKEITDALTNWKSAQEALDIAQKLFSLAQESPSRTRTGQISGILNNHSFNSAIGKSLKTSLQAHNSTIKRENIASLIESYTPMIESSIKTLAEHSKMGERIGTLIQTRTTQLTELETATAGQVTQLDTHLATLNEWASQKSTIEAQIKLMQEAQGKEKGTAKDWNATKLQPFQCQNTFPLDLTAFADTVREFIVRQIASYTNAIPLFLSKDFNLEGITHRLMCEFVKN